MLPVGISSSLFGSLIAAESDLMIEITRIDCAWPTDKGAHLESKLLARDCGVWFDLAPIQPRGFERLRPAEPCPPAAAGTIELPDLFKML
jgi:hypothetical protein